MIICQRSDGSVLDAFIESAATGASIVHCVGASSTACETMTLGLYQFSAVPLLDQSNPKTN